MTQLGFQIDPRSPVLDNIITRFKEVHPRIVVLPPDSPAVHDLHAALGNRTFLVSPVSAFGASWDAFWHGPANAKLDQAVGLWWQAAQPAVEAAPFVFWQSFTQLDDPALLPDYLAFEVARAERLGAAGAHTCAVNLSPGLLLGQRSAWGPFLTLGRTLQQYGGVVGWQEVGALYLWTGYGSNEWTGATFRAERKFPAAYRDDSALMLGFRRVYRDVLKPVGLGSLSSLITAVRLGPVLPEVTAALSPDGQPTAGWRTCIPTWQQRDGIQDAGDFYARQLLWYDAQVERDEAVLAVAVATWGSGDASDINGPVAHVLVQHLAASPRPMLRLWPEPEINAVVQAGGDVIPEIDSADTGSSGPASNRRFYISVEHPEIFDALWQQGAPQAEASRALFTWREMEGRFVIHTDSEVLWQELYLYGQVLAQRQAAHIAGGELRGQNRGDSQKGNSR